MPAMITDLFVAIVLALVGIAVALAALPVL
jgi:hypothetical protein